MSPSGCCVRKYKLSCSLLLTMESPPPPDKSYERYWDPKNVTSGGFFSGKEEETPIKLGCSKFQFL